MAKRKKSAQKAAKPIDTVSGRRGRGRPGVRASEISGRAYNYGLIFKQTWDAVGERLLKAKTKEEVVQAFDSVPYYQQEFASIASLILEVVHDPKFPKTRQARINFLANSLAGRGRVRPRRSRDICEQERKKKVHRILRQEYYVECSCGYEGPALRGKCPKCGPNELFVPFLNFFHDFSP